MKRAKGFLIVAVVLLCAAGCNEPQTVSDVSSASEVTSVNEQTPVDTQTTTTPSTTTSAASEEIQDAPQDSVTRISPEFKEGEGAWYITEMLNDDDIKALIGYDTPVDVTQLWDYVYITERLDECDDAERRELVDRNYSSILLRRCYVGTDNADWLCCATYYLDTGCPTEPYYSKLFYVSGGAVTDILHECECGFGSFSYLDDDIIAAFDNCIYSLPRGGYELTPLVETQNWVRVHEVNDEYILYADNDRVLQLYYFDSGENFSTEIYEGLQDGTYFAVGDDVIYFADLLNGGYMALDLKTREYTNLDATYKEISALCEDERCACITNEGRLSVDAPDGQKLYSLDSFKAAADDVNAQAEILVCDGETLYLSLDGAEEVYLFRLDTRTDECDVLSFDRERYENCYLNYDKNADMFFLYNYNSGNALVVVEPVRYTDADGALTEDYAERCMELLEEREDGTCHILPDLWDFDKDGVPELIVVRHTGAQGNMTAEVVDIRSGKPLGEISGYCRDGFTRFSYDGDDTVIHLYYQHSSHIRNDSWTKVSIQDGVISVIDEDVKTAGHDGVSLGWGDSFSRFEWTIYGESEYSFRRAEEYALFDYQNMVNTENSLLIQQLTDKYDSIAAMKKEAQIKYELLGFFPEDYNGDGRVEAFFQAKDGTLCFIDAALDITELGSYPSYHVYKVDDCIVFQMLSNGMPCQVWGVSAECEPILHKAASSFMDFDWSPHENGMFVGYDSEYDSNNVGGHHTWKPYYFMRTESGFVLHDAVSLSVGQLLQYDNAQTYIDEIGAVGGDLREIYQRGSYININYVIPEVIPTITADGIESEYTVEHNYYITLKLIGDMVEELERGSGIYRNYRADVRLPSDVKAEELSGTVLEKIDDYMSGSSIALIKHGEARYDIWHFSGNEERLVYSAELWGDIGTAVYREGGVSFMILFEGAIGGAMPASVVGIYDGEPLVLSEYYGDDHPRLWWCPYGDIICERGKGVSAGSCNVIPYHWDSGKMDFVPYALTEITKDELRVLDTKGIIPDIDSAISVYRRENGLIHVNYAEVYEGSMGSGVTASLTFVLTDNGLREYEFDADMKYGLLLEALTVCE